jgi:hypothetical protein
MVIDSMYAGGVVGEFLAVEGAETAEYLDVAFLLLHQVIIGYTGSDRLALYFIHHQGHESELTPRHIPQISHHASHHAQTRTIIFSAPW